MNNTFQLRKAERKQAKLRIGITGPSGSGKTYSALLLAYGITGDWDKIALIDTENGSGELYSDLGPYNVITLTAPYSPERYIAAIEAAENAGMEAIIIDSASHEWEGKGGILELVDAVANAKFRGNTWAAWSELTPRHQKFIEKITTSPTHIITTTRAKTDSVMTDDNKVKKVGTKEIQREGFEYELTISFTLDRDQHLAVASKDRTGLFIERDPFLITAETGKELRDWNQSAKPDMSTLKRELVRQANRLDIAGIGGVPSDPNDALAYIKDTVQVVLDEELETKDPEKLAAQVERLKQISPEEAKKRYKESKEKKEQKEKQEESVADEIELDADTGDKKDEKVKSNKDKK